MADSSRRKLTPRHLAKRYGVSVDKILTWIRSGELRAITAATKLGGRPRFLIDEDDVREFETCRAVQASRISQKRKRRQGRQRDVIEFF